MAGIGTLHLRDGATPLLRFEHLTVEFRLPRRQIVKAVSDVSLDVLTGETLGIVGESGCGKSTLARAVVQLQKATSGTIAFDGEELTVKSSSAVRRLRPKMQIIFQDPVSSLNPRRRVKDILREPLRIWHVSRDEGDAETDTMLNAVGLDPSVVSERRPHELSGGQCQRISIARALMLSPKLLVCDEPVSSLDVSIQAQILNLLEDLKQEHGLTMMFIAHDLAVVKNVSDRIAVMYLGRLCEVGQSDRIYEEPAHPYTRALLEAVPSVTSPSPPKLHLSGEVPSPVAPPSGCRFRTRCPLADEVCAAEVPNMRLVKDDHYVACHHPLTGADGSRTGEGAGSRKARQSRRIPPQPPMSGEEDDDG